AASPAEANRRSRSCQASHPGLRSCPSLLKDVHELAVSTRDLGDRAFPRALAGPPSDQRLPEVRPADGKANEPRDAGRRRQPLAHLGLIFTPAQDDAADFAPALAARCCHDVLAVLAPVESLDLPDVGLNLGVLELLDHLDHQAGTELRVIRLPVSLEPV